VHQTNKRRDAQTLDDVSRESTVSLPYALRLYWIALLALSALMLASQVYFWHTSIHANLYPYSNPLFQDYSHDFDFLVYKERFQHFGQVSFFNGWNWPYSYPAPIALIYKVFYSTGADSLGIFLGFSYAFYAVAALLFTRGLIRTGIAPLTASLFTIVVTLSSYPAMLQLFLANMEIMVFVVLTLGIWGYATGRDYLAAACFGVAASMKIFPFVFLALFHARRQYRQMLFGVGVLCTVSVASLWVLGPTTFRAYQGVRAGVAAFGVIYIKHFNPMESGMDHSLFALAKVGLVVMSRQAALRHGATFYLVVVAGIGITLYFIRIRHLPEINQVVILAVASVLLPPVSHDYTLLNLYGPWAMVVFAVLEARKRRVLVPGLHAALFCFLILFTAQNYLIVRNGPLENIRIAGQLKAIILLLLASVAIKYPFSDVDDSHGWPHGTSVP